MKKIFSIFFLFLLLTIDVSAINEYSASGNFSPQVIGWKLPNLKTNVDLYEFTEGTDGYQGLYKEANLFKELKGQEFLPYDMMEYLPHETVDHFAGIIGNYYYEKVVLESLSEYLLLPLQSEWEGKVVGDSFVFHSSNEQDIEIQVKGKSRPPKTANQMKIDIGKIYATKFGKILENFERHSFFMFDHVNDGKGAVIALLYGSKQVGGDFFLEIYTFEIDGEERHILASSSNADQVMAWYLLFAEFNQLGIALGYY